jgi:hypothetical protein
MDGKLKAILVTTLAVARLDVGPVRAQDFGTRYEASYNKYAYPGNDLAPELRSPAEGRAPHPGSTPGRGPMEMCNDCLFARVGGGQDQGAIIPSFPPTPASQAPQAVPGQIPGPGGAMGITGDRGPGMPAGQ